MTCTAARLVIDLASRKTTAESLFRKADISAGPNSCWMWRGRVTRRYGVISMENRPVRAHRAAWMLTKGEIPKGMVVCHACDQPLCVNPAHLWLGTTAQNNEDCRLKGRNAFGEKHAAANLKVSDVQEIRCLRNTFHDRRRIAEIYGTSVYNLYRVWGRYSWDHLPEPDAADMARAMSRVGSEPQFIRDRVLVFLRDAGGPVSTAEIVAALAEKAVSVSAILTKFKISGLVENPARGVWRLASDVKSVSKRDVA